jgi:membrane protein
MVASNSLQDDRTDDSSGRGGDDDPRGRRADSPTEIPGKGWKDVGKRVWAEMKENHTQLLASGVAFWAFTSLFPALIAAITLYGLIVDPEDVAERVDDLAEALPEEARSLIQEQLEGITAASGGALGLSLLISLGAALWAASAAMSNLMEAINAVYDEHDDRKFPKKKGIALLLTLGAIVFLGVAVTAIGAVPAVLQAIGIEGALRAVLSLAVWPILGAAFVGGLAVLYRYAPDRDDAQWRWVTPGALVGMGLWVVASLAFQFYTANFGSYQETYGALAAVVILLLWLLITALCVLIGAHVNAEMEAQTGRDTTVNAEQPMGQRGAYKADNLGEIDADTSAERKRKEADPDNNQIDLREEHVR